MSPRPPRRVHLRYALFTDRRIAYVLQQPASAPKMRYIVQASLINAPLNDSKQDSMTNIASIAPSEISTPSPGRSAAAVNATPQMTKSTLSRTLSSAGKKKKPDQQHVSDWKWKLRVISSGTASVVMTKDTEKEDRYKAMKDAWEAANPGRLVRAKELRDSYLRGEGIGASNVASPAPKSGGRDRSAATHSTRSSILSLYHLSQRGTTPTGSQHPMGDPLEVEATKKLIPRVLLESDIQTREESRAQRASQFQKTLEEVRKERTADKEFRSQFKQLQFQPLEKLASELDSYTKEDNTRRSAYRKYVKECEDLRIKKLAEAAQEAALAAEPVDMDSDKKKKGGKK